MHISLRNVYLEFSEDTPILQNISFEIPRGTRLALIGESGAGKSSIAGLLMRKKDPTGGTIFVNGKPLQDYNLSSVLRHIGVILQRPEMISGNVRENVLLATHGDDLGKITDSDIWRVLDTISPSMRERFRKNGLDTLVGKQGLQLSGGEQQRICIARALIKNPELLIVDEATASLDAKNQAMVQEGIDVALSHGVSALVIAHRFSTLRNCNKFVVLRRPSACKDGESQIEAICDSLEALYRESSTFRELASYEGVSF